MNKFWTHKREVWKVLIRHGMSHTKGKYSKMFQDQMTNNETSESRTESTFISKTLLAIFVTRDKSEFFITRCVIKRHLPSVLYTIFSNPVSKYSQHRMLTKCNMNYQNRVAFK